MAGSSGANGMTKNVGESPPGVLPVSSTTVAGITDHGPGHSFLSAVAEVRNMEHSLLDLLNSFHSGELSAFGSGTSLETMEAIRAKQERLARLHFDTGASKGQLGDSTQQNWMSDTDQNNLVAGLRELSVEIEKLHEKSS